MPLPQAPTFRAGIDLVRIDAVVVDGTGVPIRGLKAEDFTISEDGNPREIAGFEAIDLPIDRPAAPGEAAWVSAAPRDVVTNKIENGRLFMVVVDDAVMPPDPRAIARAKAIASDVVSRLGPSDQAAIVFTMNSKKSQGFTADHSRLAAAINATTFGGKHVPTQPGDEQYDIASAWTLANAVDALKAAPQLRKTLVFISKGASFSSATLGPSMSTVQGGNPLSGGEAARRILDELNRLFLDATRAHVNVYAFDVKDFGDPDIMGPERDYLRTIANNTGGRAVIANEDPVQGVTQMFRESSEYYVLAFTSGSASGRHRVDIRTTIPGATVLARKTFELASPNAAASKASPLASSIAGLLPVDSLPMRATATALPGPPSGEAIVAVALGINQPAENLNGAKEKMTAQIDAYQTDGKFAKATKLDAQLALNPSPSGRAQYELLAKLSLKPGRYQLRIAAHSPRLNLRGSVFVDVDVPDFSRERVAVAPLVLSTSPAPPAAPADAFATLLPVIPTSHRTFGAADTVSILARITQGGKNPLESLAIEASVVDTTNRRIFGRTETITPDGRTGLRSADYSFGLPMSTLNVGDYLLTVKATTSNATSERTLRFSRR